MFYSTFVVSWLRHISDSKSKQSDVKDSSPTSLTNADVYFFRPRISLLNSYKSLWKKTLMLSGHCQKEMREDHRSGFSKNGNRFKIFPFRNDKEVVIHINSGTTDKRRTTFICHSSGPDRFCYKVPSSSNPSDSTHTSSTNQDINGNLINKTADGDKMFENNLIYAENIDEITYLDASGLEEYEDVDVPNLDPLVPSYFKPPKGYMPYEPPIQLVFERVKNAMGELEPCSEKEFEKPTNHELKNFSTKVNDEFGFDPKLPYSRKYKKRFGFEEDFLEKEEDRWNTTNSGFPRSFDSNHTKKTDDKVFNFNTNGTDVVRELDENGFTRCCSRSGMKFRPLMTTKDFKNSKISEVYSPSRSANFSTRCSHDKNSQEVVKGSVRNLLGCPYVKPSLSVGANLGLSPVLKNTTDTGDLSEESQISSFSYWNILKNIFFAQKKAKGNDLN